MEPRWRVEEINASGGVLGRPLRLIVKDTQSRPGSKPNRSSPD